MTGRNIAITCPDIDENSAESAVDLSGLQHIGEAPSGMSLVEWSKSSPISARTVVLEAEAAFGRIDEAVLYFDEEWFARQGSSVSGEECVRGCDELILPYQCLVMELLCRFERKYAAALPGKLVFLIKETPSVADSLRAPAVRNGVGAIASPVVASAAAAFMTFAENIAALYGDKEFVNIFLMRGNVTSPVAANDSECGRWLAEYLDESESSRLQLDAKKSLVWIKAGARAGGLSLFRKKAK